VLVFFHCHKAAGTTVTRAAEASGMKLPEGHRNGNPVDATGKLVDWSGLGKAATLDLFAEYERQGVDMLAVEFSFPAWSTLTEIPDLRMFTVLREPAARALSNFRMDVLNNHIARERVFGFAAFMNGASLFRADNYYTRFFSRIPPKAKICKDHLDFAKRRLAQFDSVCVLEKGNLPEKLAPLGFDRAAFGWQNANRDKKKFQTFDVEQEGIDLKSFPDDPEFYAVNCYDYALYAYFMNKEASV